ncbi:esterase/lipase family protein [Streptomyces lavendulae]|uniref:esterase/lipase family protein n=1 Tax=Streptomyces lavendulae TaxID=1914 RepID=UPI0024A018CE|nr:alpha/beta fold hydrolase [Streptomyces lavendulae]GLW04178.1 lipase [Streptomyces lavendulae subsp. lavendulae]
MNIFDDPYGFPPPPDANDTSCSLDPQHPSYPVVLVNGTFNLMYDNWKVLSPKLRAAGYCVFAFNYGGGTGLLGRGRGLGPVANSALELQAFVNKVMDFTGAAKVDIVGHSQGGMMPRYYVKKLDGLNKVNHLIGLAPANHGTKNPLVGPASFFCDSCADMTSGSDFLDDLNAGNETPVTPTGPYYTVITTKLDEILIPYDSAMLKNGPSAYVTNIVLQDKCPLDVIDHHFIANDPIVARWVLHTLGRRGKPADPNFKPSCLPF